MGYLGNFEGSGVLSKIDSQRFNGNNSDTSFTLRHSVSQPEHIEVFVENVRQDPFTAYTVSNKTLTFTGTPPTGTGNIYVVFLGGAINTSELPPENNLGLRDGISSAPSLFRGSQIGTGLFFPAANTISMIQNDKQMFSANATNIQLKVRGVTILDANSSGINVIGSIKDDGSTLTSFSAVTANTQLNAGVVTAHAIATGAVGTTEIEGNAVGALQLNANAVVGDIVASNGAFTHNTNTFAKAQRARVESVTVAAANVQLNFANANIFNLTLNINTHLNLPSNVTAGQAGTIIVKQDGTGSRTLSYASSWEFPSGTAPTLTTTASAEDRIDYVVVAANAIHAVATLNYG
jgi:hypothetical protein